MIDLEQVMDEPKSGLTLIFGRICSGKSVYAKKQECSISVSKIVRDLINSASRSDLQSTAHLDATIAEKLLADIDEAYDYVMDLYIEGIRQISIVETILERYPNANMIWLEVPTEERKRRYELRADLKDVESFEVADNKFLELESLKILDTFRDRITIVNNY
jgi:predicted kinase